jgi:putative ABC transport system ATP-binding protein
MSGDIMKDIMTMTGVSRFYKSGDSIIKAVDNLSLTIKTGEFTVLAGPSGSGKTTLLNLIGGLDQADSGELYIDGEPLFSRRESELTSLRLNKIGFIFQAYNLLPVLTVYENVQFILQIRKIPESRHKEMILPVLKELGLEEMKNRFPAQLSGGQQQRVAVARAIVGGPAIVLADEPTANLDSDTSHSLLSLMRQLNDEKNITFLFSSHDPVVIHCAKRVIHLRDGHIVEDEGSLEDL